tara:strand:- start:3047 stop:6580 length:3534 start_codon:yes stop_codon:yes gene_type:complete
VTPPNRNKYNITDEEKKALESLRSRLLESLTRSEQTIPNYGIVENPDKLPVKPDKGTPTCSCMFLPYDIVGSEDLNLTVDGECNTSRNCHWEYENYSEPAFDYKAHCKKLESGGCACECKHYSEFEDSDTGSITPFTSCNPSENQIGGGGLNQTCIELNSDTPYCNQDAVCVECINDDDCPLDVGGRNCINYQCSEPDTAVLQCDDSLAINFQTDISQYQCPSSASECISFFQTEYGMFWPHTESDMLSDGCCCYNLLGVDVESLQGDMNGDGSINVLDVVIMVNIIIGDGDPPVDNFYLPPYNPGTGDSCPAGTECFVIDEDGTPTGYYTDIECQELYNCDTLDCCDGLIPEDDCNTCCDPCPDLPILGCTDDGANNPYGEYPACNYDSTATQDDNSCTYTVGPDSFSGPGEGPFACDGFMGGAGTCLGFLDTDVLHMYPEGSANQGQQCDGSCGKSTDPIPNKIKILDCNGTCISLNIWLNYVQNDPYDEPGVCMDGISPNANFACTSATQVDGQEFYFNCSLGNCEDNCGACLGINECGDCNGVPHGASDFDAYPLSETTLLTVTDDQGGCCPADTRIKYYLDLDGDGLGEDTPTNESPDNQGYSLCADNPNLSDHCYSPTNDVGCGAFDNLTDCENAGCTFGTPFVSNQLDNCPNGGYIDICGNCTTDADYPGTAVCGGCTDDATPACNYDEEAIWDDGSCFYTYDNNTSYCNCADDSQPDPGFDCDGNCITFIDCFGECGGTAVEDCSGECDGDAVVCQTEGACNIGVCAPCSFPPAYRDCNGNCINDVDMDGICDEDDDCVGEYDECGECNGTGILDDCGVCDGTGYDECGTCDGSLVDLGCGCGNPAPIDCTVTIDSATGDTLCGPTSTCYPDFECYTRSGCDNQCGSTAELDECGVCDGDGPPTNYDCNGDCIAVVDCAGVCGGTSEIDDCDECTGDVNYQPESCYGCTYESADNFDPLATIDNGDCVFGLRAESDNVELLGDLLIPSAVGEKETYWHTFYYPYSQSIPAFDLYNNIWLENPIDICVDADGESIPWKDCDMSSVPTLAVVENDLIESYSRNGMNKQAAFIFGVWNTSSQDPNETNFGNADDSCNPDIPGTCIEKGFVGRIGLNVDYECTPNQCTGSCPSQALPGGSYTCDCGVREEMLDCDNVIGWLKFKQPEPPGDIE